MDKASKVFRVVQILAAVVTIAAGAVRIWPYFQQPEIIYATKDLVSYPLAYDAAGNLTGPEVQAKVLVGKPIKLQGLVVQNKGHSTATDILVRIPVVDSDGYLGGWMARGDSPMTHYMKDQTTEYKIDKLVPEESVSFYIYLRNSNSNLADRIEVYDGRGHRASYYPYIPMRAGFGSYYLLPRWGLYTFFVFAIVMAIPSPAQIKTAREYLKKKFGDAGAQPPQTTRRPRKANARSKPEA